ncbi:glycosyltransferase family 4 protein [Desulfosarcina sp.]|uniref:glycosyltransferase family 4 protein n=1 Tax=Desulfosarcina sp. TaxID=2027861 RepID=UPI0039704EFB
MRVLILSQYFWPESFQINDVVTSLVQKGIEVEVLTGKPNYPSGEIFSGYRARGCNRETHGGVPIHRIPLVARGSGGWRLALNYASFVLSGLLFAPVMLRKQRFDAVLVYAPSPILQTIPALFVARRKGCPLVLWIQDLWPESLSATGYVTSRALLAMVRTVVAFIYRRSDLLLVQSRAFEKPVRALVQGTPIVYHPNSVDEVFALPPKGELPAITGLDQGFSVLFAGNIGSAQAVETIVEAALRLKKYPDIHLVVLGEGSRRQWMLRQVRAHKIDNLYLPGSFPVETMPGLMQKASALLVTLADREIFSATVPSKLQAYLAAGRPILACLNGEGAKLVDAAGAGLSVSAENGPALARAIVDLYQMSPQEREIMGARGRSYYRQYFAHDMLVQRLIEHLRSVGPRRKALG